MYSVDVSVIIIELIQMNRLYNQQSNINFLIQVNYLRMMSKGLNVKRSFAIQHVMSTNLNILFEINLFNV